MLPHPRELLTDNFALIKGAVRFACRRHRFNFDEAEEFASIVNVKLVDDDYAVLRTFDQRSQFSTWINVVVQRAALDFRIAAWGKWHASAEAKRLGQVAVELEYLLHHDGQPLEAAFTILIWNHPITREELHAIADRLPPRQPRPRPVQLEEGNLPGKPATADEALLQKHWQSVAQRVSAFLSKAMRDLPDQDRLIFQFLFERGMSVAQIARSLQLDQKQLYRRIKKRLDGMQEMLVENGIDPVDVADLIGRDGLILEFDLRNRKSRPSNEPDEDATAPTEDSP